MHEINTWTCQTPTVWFGYIYGRYNSGAVTMGNCTFVALFILEFLKSYLVIKALFQRGWKKLEPQKGLSRRTWLIVLSWLLPDWCIPANPFACCRIFLHLNHVSRICLKILWNHKFYRKSLDSHHTDVKSLIQGTLSQSKDDLWVVMLYSFANGACPSGTEIYRD